MSLRLAWRRFWHSEQDPAPLAAFRAAFALCVMADIETSREMSVFALAGGFHLPYLAALPHLSPGLYNFLHHVQYPLCAALAAGFFPRACAAALALAAGVLLFADQLNFRNHAYLFWLILSLLAFAPRGKGPGTIRRLIQVQVCLAYFLAGLHKLHPGFLEGQTLRHALDSWLPRSFAAEAGLEGLVRAAADFPPALVAAALVSAVLELTLPFALWSARWRPWAMAAGAAFHAVIGMTMDIPWFSAAMVSSYLLFLEPAALKAYAPRLSRSGGRG